MYADLGGSPSGQQSAEQHFPLGNEFLEPVGPEEDLGQSDHFYEDFQHSFLSDIPLVSDLPQHTTTAPPLPLQSASISGGSEVEEHRLSAKRTQKADREKLRRDKLNDQFLELANALDSDLVKNDKASILVESLQAVRELRAEVKRLKTEHASLLNETRDLTEEKNELREEKASLRSETERLQSQLGQCLHSISPWMSMDPSSIMMPPPPPSPFPFPIPGLPQYISMHPSSSHHAPPYIPLPSSPSIMNPFPSHLPLPRAQPSTSLGIRAIGETSHSSQRPTTIERPSAQYPVLVQPSVASAASFMRIPPSQKGSQAKMTPAVPLKRPISAIASAFSQSSQGFQKGKESHVSCIPPTNQGDCQTGWHQNPPPNSSFLPSPIQALGPSTGKQDLRPDSCRAFQIREHGGSSSLLVHEAKSRGKATIAAKLSTELVNPFPSLSGSSLANELEGLPLCDSLQGGFDPDYDAILRPPAA